MPPAGYVFAFLALFVARPLSLTLSLAGSRLSFREMAAASWFGPRGFSSVFFAMLILGSSVPQAGPIFNLMAVVIAASIVLHSSTDVMVARWVERENGYAGGGSSGDGGISDSESGSGGGGSGISAASR